MAKGKKGYKRYGKKKTLTKKVNMLVKRMKPEIKSFDQAVTQTNVDLTGFTVCLSNMAQSLDMTGRIGRQIQPIDYRCYCELNKGTTAGLFQWLRMIWFQDKEFNGTLPGVLDVIQNASPTSQYNVLQSKGRFKILRDKLYVFSNSSDFARADVMKVKVPLQINYEGTSSATADQGKNALCMLLISSDPVTLQAPYVTIRHRLRYRDA